MKCKCKRCGYEWESRVKRPKTCARCKSYTWEIKRKEGELIDESEDENETNTNTGWWKIIKS